MCLWSSPDQIKWFTFYEFRCIHCWRTFHVSRHTKYSFNVFSLCIMPCSSAPSALSSICVELTWIWALFFFVFDITSMHIQAIMLSPQHKSTWTAKNLLGAKNASRYKRLHQNVKKIIFHWKTSQQIECICIQDKEFVSSPRTNRITSEFGWASFG